MEGGRIQEAEEDSRRWRRDGEERGDCGSTGERKPAVTPSKDDRRAEIERRRNKQGTVASIEDRHAPSHTANIRGDSNTGRESKDVVCRCINNSQAEHPSYRDRRRVRGYEEGHDSRVGWNSGGGRLRFP